MLSDALLSSPILVGEDGAAVPSGIAGLEYGVDPNEDPELALVRILQVIITFKVINIQLNTQELCQIISHHELYFK